MGTSSRRMAKKKVQDANAKKKVQDASANRAKKNHTHVSRTKGNFAGAQGLKRQTAGHGKKTKHFEATWKFTCETCKSAKRTGQALAGCRRRPTWTMRGCACAGPRRL